MKINVGVIFGGKSVEHEVSIISAIQAMNKLDREKYNVIPIYISKDGEWYAGEVLKDIEMYQDTNLIKRYSKNVVLCKRKKQFILLSKGLFKRAVAEVDVILPIVHGTNVEDGTLQGYLQTIGIPYALSNVYASVVGQDKVYMKNIFKDNDLPIVDYVWFYDNEYLDDKEEVLKRLKKLKYPVIVKPASLGSSVGINVAKDEEKLIYAIEEAIKYDEKIIVEEIVSNLKEVNISVLGNYAHQELSVIEEIYSRSSFLTYEEKYLGKGKSKGKLTPQTNKYSKGMASASRKIPADLTEKTQEEVQRIAAQAFKVLGSSGVVRIDFLLDDKANKVYINEINSIPGSLSFYLWEKSGKKYSELLDEIINIAIRDYKKRISKINSFNTNILNNYDKYHSVKGKVK